METGTIVALVVISSLVILEVLFAKTKVYEPTSREVLEAIRQGTGSVHHATKQRLLPVAAGDNQRNDVGVVLKRLFRRSAIPVLGPRD